MVERIRNETMTIGTNSVLISEAQIGKSQRKALVITNTSVGGQVMSLTWGQEAAAGIGVVLYGTGSWSESLDSKFTPSNERIYAISSAAGGTLAIHERIIEG